MVVVASFGPEGEAAFSTEVCYGDISSKWGQMYSDASYEPMASALDTVSSVVALRQVLAAFRRKTALNAGE